MTTNIVPSSTLQVSDLDGQLVVDSRLIATRLGVQHDTLFKTIEKYSDRLSVKAELRFKIEFRERAQGGKSKVRYALLDERQATLLMTYSRNTEQVLDCKDALVDAFDKAKRIIKTVIPDQNDRIRELELELLVRQADQKLLDTRDAIIKLQPKAIADRILGVTEIATTEIRTKIVDDSGFVLNAANTVSKTELANRYGFVSKSGRADTKTVTRLIDEAIAAGAISQPWHDVRVVASAGFDAALVPVLDRFFDANPATRQRWMGE